MSSYLQRLVSSAMKPTAGVHPVVAPLFSTVFDITEEEPVEHEAAPQRTQASFEHILPGSVPVAPAAVHLHQASSDPQPARPAAQFGQEHVSDQKTPRVPRPADAREVDSAHPVYEPLLPLTPSPLPVHLHQSDSRSESLPGTVSQRKTESAAMPRHSLPTKHEPDEIQITIGRIEVTAVPETTRPAAKPTRRQLSLDEYLKHADARGR
jgi:hypothetical protein